MLRSFLRLGTNRHGVVNRRDFLGKLAASAAGGAVALSWRDMPVARAAELRQQGKAMIVNFKHIREYPSPAGGEEFPVYIMGLKDVYPKGFKEIRTHEVLMEGKNRPLLKDQLYHIKYIDTDDQGYRVESSRQEGEVHFDAVIQTAGFTLKAPQVRIKERENRVKFIILSKVKAD